MDDIFKGLTEAQCEAVSHVDGPLLILAGPGSGKTRVVTHRIANMLRQGVKPWNIAALTFTNKAADEMRMRVQLLAPSQPVWLGTFHRFCAKLLRRYAPMVGLAENYSIYDTADSKQAMKRAIEAAGVSTSHTSPEQIAATISRAKNRLVTPDMMLGQAMRSSDAIAARVYPVYQQQLKTANAVDFDDLLLHIATLLKESPEVRADLDAKFRYIMVDEYQDTNLAQYAIVRALSIDYPNLAVTGDPDQSIYGWRGADLNNILDFEKDYPSVKTVRLEQNYRSTPNILRCADQLIGHNRRRKKKGLFTDNEEGEPVILRFFENGYQEADGVADAIASAMITEGLRPRDFAVFCRMNALTRSLEHSLRNRGLPYQIINGLEFYQRKEIKDLLAYLHLINNPSHDVAFTRIVNTPTRGIGAKTVERIREYADEHRIPMLEAARNAWSIEGLAKRSATMVAGFVALYDRLCIKSTATLEDLLRYLIEETKFREYLERSEVEGDDTSPMANVDELVSGAVEFDRRHPEDGSLEAFLEQVALVSDTDKFEDSNDRVTIMTMHAAKGLEFPRVFIIAVEDDLLPHARSKESEDQIEEERRLLFVGITRAKQWLQLSCCKSRTVRGDFRPVIPSPFLNELPLGELKRIDCESNQEWFDDDPYGSDDFDMGYPDSWDLPEIDVLGDSNLGGDDFAGNHPPDSIAAKGTGAGKSATGKTGGGKRPAVDVFADDVCQLPDEEREKLERKNKPPVKLSGLKTGADLMSSNSTPLGAYREGSLVRHDEYGDGRIVAVTGHGPKRTATVRFDDGDHQFRLAYARLVLVE